MKTAFICFFPVFQQIWDLQKLLEACSYAGLGKKIFQISHLNHTKNSQSIFKKNIYGKSSIKVNKYSLFNIQNYKIFKNLKIKLLLLKDQAGLDTALCL